jgi:hypothetical protein
MKKGTKRCVFVKVMNHEVEAIVAVFEAEKAGFLKRLLKGKGYTKENKDLWQASDKSHFVLLERRNMNIVEDVIKSLDYLLIPVEEES